jgi:hypothetical protein
MKFGLSVPFRTLLNAESEHLSVHRQEAARELERAFSSAAARAEVMSVEVLEPSLDDTKRGLRTLADDSIPWFCRPLAKVHLSDVYFREVITRFADAHDDPLWRPLIASLELGGYIECFDNTLAVASLTGALDLSRVPSGVDPSVFECFLSDLADAAVRDFSNTILSEPLSALSGRKVGGAPFTRPQNAYLIFSDLNHHPYPRWSQEDHAMFWAHRIYVVDEEMRNSPAVMQLLRAGDILTLGKNVRDGCHLHVGSSVVGEAGLLEDFLRSCSVSQYFYCLFDILNSNQNRMYREIASQDSMKQMRRSIKNYHRMENFIEFTGNELSNAEISFQGNRRVLFDSLNEVFGTRQLIDAVRRRDELVQSRLDRKSFLLQRSDRRTLQFVIFLLGAAQLLSLVVDLFDFAGETRNFEIAGAYDLFRWMDFNIAMHVVAILVLAGALYATIKRD